MTESRDLSLKPRRGSALRIVRREQDPGASLTNLRCLFGSERGE